MTLFIEWREHFLCTSPEFCGWKTLHKLSPYVWPRYFFGGGCFFLHNLSREAKFEVPVFNYSNICIPLHFNHNGKWSGQCYDNPHFLISSFPMSYSSRYFIPVTIENRTATFLLLLSALSSCVVCVFEPKHKSAAACFALEPRYFACKESHGTFA